MKRLEAFPSNRNSK